MSRSFRSRLIAVAAFCGLLLNQCADGIGASTDKTAAIGYHPWRRARQLFLKPPAKKNRIRRNSAASQANNKWGRRTSAHTATKEPRRKRIRRAIKNIVEGTVSPGPRVLQHSLYWFTTLDSIVNVVRNEYPAIHDHGIVLPAVYSRLFYFARLRPRLLYAVGALLRALQLCTPLRQVLDPTAGVGAGVNVCAVIAGSRWVKPVALGWATTKFAWVWLGAKKLDGAHLPITLSMR